MVRTLKIFQINLNSCRAATLQMVQFSLENNVDLVLWQDAYHSKNTFPGFPAHWQSFTSELSTAGILNTSRALDLNEIKSFPNSIFIRAKSAEGDVTVGSLYCNPSSDLEADLSD